MSRDLLRPCHDCGVVLLPSDLEVVTLPDGQQVRMCQEHARETRQATYRARVYPRGQKPCTGCKTWHPFEAFGTDRRKQCGLKSVCREYEARGRRTLRAGGDRERRAAQLRNRGTITCNGCKTERDASHFRPRPTMLGHSLTCRDCEADTRREARHAVVALTCWLCCESVPAEFAVATPDGHECPECHAEAGAGFAADDDTTGRVTCWCCGATVTDDTANHTEQGAECETCTAELGE